MFHNDNPECASLIFAIADWFTLYATASIFFINTWALLPQIQYIIWVVKEGTAFSGVYFQNYTSNFHWNLQIIGQTCSQKRLWIFKVIGQRM